MYLMCIDTIYICSQLFDYSFVVIYLQIVSNGCIILVFVYCNYVVFYHTISFIKLLLLIVDSIFLPL